MSEYKIGDMVEFVGYSVYYNKGDRFRIDKLSGSCVVDCNGIFIHKDSIRHVKETEAEKRGAKFGVTGAVKATGSKWVFACEVDGFWRGIAENGVIVSGEPYQFHLDHEPEYREIPFCEATHEQRMDVSALRFDGGPVEQIVRFDNGAYAFTTSDCEHACPITELLTVRVPT